MATIQSTTAARRNYDEPAPGHKTPHADINFLRALGASEFYPRIWQYLSPPGHDLGHFMTPGYFDKDHTDPDSPRDHLHVGDTIHYTLCADSKNPCDWRRGIAVVLENPSSAQEPLILGGVIEFPPATPWRGDDDKTKAA